VNRLNDCQEGSCVRRVAIAKEIAVVSKGTASFHGDVPSHLLHPLLGLSGDPGDLHLSAEEQHVVGRQSPQRVRTSTVKKVSSHQHREVSPNEFCPRHGVLQDDVLATSGAAAQGRAGAELGG
jgi:hypothetical protein